MPTINLKELKIIDDRLVVDHWMDEFALASISVADEIRLFDTIGDHSVSSKDLSNKMQLGEGSIEALCLVLCSVGYLCKNLNLFSLTDIAKTYWISSSPLYRGDGFKTRQNSNTHQRILKMLKEDWAPIGDHGHSFTEMWETGNLTIEAAKRFTGMMHSVILAPSVAVARSDVFLGKKHVIDAGGGSGAFCSALSTEYPELKVSLMDLPEVCEASLPYLKTYGTNHKIDRISCNFFKDPWPTDADAFFFSNILHDWPVQKCQIILEKAFDALPVGGSIFIYESLLNEDRISPRSTVVFNMMMYMNHKSQQFTESELEKLLQGVGFQKPKKVFEFGYYSLVKAEKA